MKNLAARRACIALFLLACTGLAAANVLESYGKVALPFEPNLGQTDPRVKFLARGPGLQVFLTPTDAVYRLNGPDSSSVVRMALTGARRDAQVSGLERLPGQSHYLPGAEGGEPVTHVPHFGRVKVEHVYRGIDLVYYGNGSQIEYDFIVAPGANARAIAIEVQGARRLEVDADGKLRIHTDAGSLVWKAPVAYQQRDGERLAVASSYVVRGKTRVGFRVAEYDRRLPLVIDPILEYSTLVGGTGVDFPFAIAVDAAGEAVITGQTNSAFPTTVGAYDTTSGGIFVTKLNATGSALVYSTFLGGPVRGSGVALHGGHAYVTGRTTNPNFATPGALNYAGPGQNGFVAKLNVDGSGLEWAAVIGGVSEDSQIALDGAGNVYVSGSTTSATFPVTAGAFQTTRPTLPAITGDPDAFFVKLNATGSTLLYATYLASDQLEQATGIAVDSAGMAYVTGYTGGRSADWQGNLAALHPFPTTISAYQETFTGVYSAFVTKFDPTQSGPASVVYSTLLGNQGLHMANGLAVDAAGSAYVSGSGESNFPLTAGSYGVATLQAPGAFVTKLNTSGSGLVYSAMIPAGSGGKIALDAWNNAFVAGVLLSPPSFNTVNPLPGTSTGEGFLAKLNPSGSAAEYATRIQGRGVMALAVDPAGAAYLLGDVHQVAFTATPGAYQSVINGTFPDLFVTKVATNRAPIANAGPNQTASVNFNTFTLDGAGSSDPDGDPLTFVWKDASNTEVGTSAQVTLTRPQGIHMFTLTVSDGKLSASATVTVTVNAALTMNFYGSSTGRVTSSDGQVDCGTFDFCPLALYPIPTPVTLTAVPDTGAVFYGWVNGLANPCSGMGTCTVTVNGNIVVGARFDVQQLVLSVNNGVGGKVTSIAGIDCGSTCSVALPYNSVVTLQATVDAGYLFDGWSGACSGSAPTCTVTLDTGKSVTAAYRPIALTSLAVAPPTATLAVGGQRQFTATAAFSDGTARALTDRSLESSDMHTCAIARSGLVKCVTYQNSATTPVPAYEKAIALAGGTSHMCALFANGTVNCEGTAVPLAGAAVAIASQTVTACALLSNGTVQCWNGMSQTPTPVTIIGVSNAVAIGAEAGSTTCVVIAGGSVSCWQGMGDPSTGAAPPTIVPGVLNATSVTYGVSHGCAVISDGSLMCWGENDHGQLGNGQFVTQGIYTPPTWVRDSAGLLTGVISVVSGDYHACALLSSGAAKCWGAAVGIDNYPNDSALAIPFFKQIPAGMAAIPVATAVAAGAFNVCVTIVDGTVWCQGTGPGPGLGFGMQYAPPTLMPGFNDILSLSWSSGNPGVASAMTNGVAVGRGAGFTLLTATEGSSSASTSLTVSAGTSVTTRAVSSDVSAPPVTVTFAGTTRAGTTTLASAPCVAAPPTGFQLGNPPQCFELATTAIFSPPATVCFIYDPSAFTGDPDLFHFEVGAWKKVTTTINTVEHYICGNVSSFSPFALFAKASNQCVPDVVAPSISRVAAAPNELWPANHKMTPVRVAVSVADRCDPAVRCRIVSVSSNEPINGTGDGDTAPDWKITGDMTLDLRAERSGGGDGRTYTITVRCTDASNNSATRTVGVTVPKSR